MASLSSLRSDLSYYQNFRDSMQGISAKIAQAIDALDPAISKINSCYEIDDVSADSQNISDCKSSLSNQNDYILKSVIPSIDDKINEIKREIEELEEEEKAQLELIMKD